MIKTVQLSIADAVFAEDLKNALLRSGPWNVVLAGSPGVDERSVLVLDELAFARLVPPVENPTRIVLVTRQDPRLLADAWEAGIVSVVSSEDSIATVLLAIMAAALRIAKPQPVPAPSVISPNSSALLSPDNQISRSRRCKTR